MLDPVVTASVMRDSVAPVFLISAVSVLISVMVHRYGRVIDRTRTLLRDGNKLYGKYVNSNHREKETRALYKRARILRLTIILSFGAIFFVVLAIALLYLSLSQNWSVGFASEISFLLSLFILLVSITLFTRDFAISLAALKNDIHTRADSDIFEENS